MKIINWIKACFRMGPSLRHDPWRQVPKNQPSLNGQAGKIAYVSRHGLRQRGIICPSCESVAAEPNTNKGVLAIRDSAWGEAVQCDCGTLLLASPDTDIDKIEPGLIYNALEFHRFVRPARFPRPRPRITSAFPGVGDWVAILGEVHLADGRTLGDSEGRVDEVTDSVAKVALNGNSGFAGARDLGADFVLVAVDRLVVVADMTLRPASRVVYIKSINKGKRGKIMSGSRGTFEILLESGETVWSPIEHIERFVEDETDWPLNPSTTHIITKVTTP